MHKKITHLIVKIIMKLLLPLLLLACFLLVATARKSDLKQVDAAARAIGVDRKKFGTYIHATKDGADYTYAELLNLARECKANGQC